VVFQHGVHVTDLLWQILVILKCDLVYSGQTLVILKYDLEKAAIAYAPPRFFVYGRACVFLTLRNRMTTLVIAHRVTGAE
jgi:hypothetical protein